MDLITLTAGAADLFTATFTATTSTGAASFGIEAVNGTETSGLDFVDNSAAYPDWNVIASYATPLSAEVIAKAVTSIAVTTAPSKTVYTAGETFDKTGMVVTATYNDGTTAVLADTTYSVSDSALLVTDTTATITYLADTSKIASASITVNPAEPTYTLGDVDNDGKIDASDSLQALRHSVGLITLTDNPLLAADVASNGVVDASDSLQILRYSVGLISAF